MLVAHELKLLFAHVPKTGGSSITAALRPWLKCKVPPGRRRSIETHNWQGEWHEIGPLHSTWRQVRGVAQPLVNQGYMLVTVLRSPFDRIASLWSIQGSAQGGRSGPDGIPPYEYMTTRLPPLYLNTVLDFVGPNPARTLNFYRLREDFAALCDDLGIKAELPHVNRHLDGVTPGLLREVYSDPRCVEFVLDRFAPEIEAYGFQAPNLTE